MEAFLVVALIGFALLAAELLLPTGGVLAALGVIGLVAAGVLALDSDSGSNEAIGAALITLGLLSGATFYFVTRKVIEAHRGNPPRTGSEELTGATAEARTSIDPEGRVWLEGTLWSARLADPSSPVRSGDRVTVEAVDGLTLVVRPQPQPSQSSAEGAS